MKTLSRTAIILFFVALVVTATWFIGQNTGSTAVPFGEGGREGFRERGEFPPGEFAAGEFPRPERFAGREGELRGRNQGILGGLASFAPTLIKMGLIIALVIIIEMTSSRLKKWRQSSVKQA